MPARGTILLQKPETEERFSGGIIVIPQISRERLAANQMVVVSVGLEEICAWPEDCSEVSHRFVSLKEVTHPLDPRVRPGAWVIIRPRSLVELPDGLFLVRQNEIYGVFHDAEAEAIEEITSRTEPERLTTATRDVA